MKITMAFGIYNKAQWLAPLMTSWLTNLSDKHQYEVIVVCDACVDESASIAMRTMKEYPHIHYIPLETPDVHEIAVNNIALKHAATDSDIIIFIQDDNWIYDPGWDEMLAKVFDTVEKVGAVGLLAGVNFDSKFHRSRVECDRAHKGDSFAVHNLAPRTLGIYPVDAAIRPFAVRTALLRKYGGLGKGFDLVVWDDIELSFRLIRDGYMNLYVPFDLVNTSEIAESMNTARWRQSFAFNEQLTKKRHLQWLQDRETPAHECLFLLEDHLFFRKGQIVSEWIDTGKLETDHQE